MKRIVPNFIIVGAAKAGTTAIYHYLKQHPQIFMSPKKEANFFSLVGNSSDYFEYGGIPPGPGGLIDTPKKYDKLFIGSDTFDAVGEASPWYLFDPDVPSRIQKFNPDMKIICILRNPADRAYSEFGHYIRDGKEPYGIDDFLKAFQEGAARRLQGWHPHWDYSEKGFYAKHLTNFLAVFPQSQMKIYLYEELRNSPLEVIESMFGFLGVATDFRPDISQRYNVTGVPKSRKLQDFVKRPNLVKKLLRPFLTDTMRHKLREKVEQKNLKSLPRMTDEQRAFLVEYYKEDIDQLEILLNKNLSSWKSL